MNESLRYAIQCEVHHALLGVASALVLLGVYYLMWWIMAILCQEERHIIPSSWSAWLSLSALAFGMGLVGHYLADYGYIPGWRW